MDEGWIKIHRRLKKHWIWIDAEKFRAWITILMEVNHDDKMVLIQGELIECKRGQSIKSIGTWAKEFRWTPKKFRTFLKVLENDSMIVREGLHKTTRITVCNYDSYQDKGQTKGTQKANRGQTEGKQRATNKNVKNVKNVKNNINKGAKTKISEPYFDKGVLIEPKIVEQPEYKSVGNELRQWANDNPKQWAGILGRNGINPDLKDEVDREITKFAAHYQRTRDLTAVIEQKLDEFQVWIINRHKF